MEEFGALRGLLEVPNEENWKALCERLWGWPKEEERDQVVLPYVLDHLEAWEDALRAFEAAPDALSNLPYTQPTHPLNALFRDFWWEGEGAQELLSLLRPSPAMLRKLTIWDCADLGVEGLRALMESPSLRDLRTLSLASCGLDDDALRFLASDSPWSLLEQLELWDNSFSNEGILALAQSSLFPSLSTLDLEGNWRVTRAAIGTLLHSLTMPALQKVRAPWASTREATARSLKEYGVFPPAPEDDTVLARVQAAGAYLTQFESDWRFEAADRSSRDALLSEALETESMSHSCVYWDADIWSKAFDAQGNLCAPLEMTFASSWFHGGGKKIQTAFAEAGLSPTFSFISEEDDRLQGSLLLEPATITHSSDLVQICRALRTLRERVYFAYPCLRETSSAGWEHANGACNPHGEGELRAIFWNFQGHCFDTHGMLTSSLALQWEGDPEEITEVFQTHQLRFTTPPDENTTFMIHPADTEMKTA